MKRGEGFTLLLLVIALILEDGDGLRSIYLCAASITASCVLDLVCTPISNVGKRGEGGEGGCIGMSCSNTSSSPRNLIHLFLDLCKAKYTDFLALFREMTRRVNRYFPS